MNSDSEVYSSLYDLKLKLEFHGIAATKLTMNLKTYRCLRGKLGLKAGEVFRDILGMKIYIDPYAPSEQMFLAD